MDGDISRGRVATIATKVCLEIVTTFHLALVQSWGKEWCKYIIGRRELQRCVSGTRIVSISISLYVFQFAVSKGTRA